jgi:hypothetical protein
MGVEYGSHSGGSSLDAGENDTSVVVERRERTYIVLGDNTSDDEETIATTAGLPAIGVSSVGSAVCSNIQFKEEDIVVHPVTGVRVGFWKVKCQFDTRFPPKKDEDPTKAAPTVDWDGASRTEVLEFDVVDGRRIMTTAGEPIFTETDITDDILTVTRFEHYPTSSITRQYYRGKVNLTSFYGYPPGCVKLDKISAPMVRIKGVRYAKVAYTFLCRTRFDTQNGTVLPHTWRTRLLNNGYYYRKTKFGIPEVHLDKKGHPQKVNLDIDGLLLQNVTGSNLVQYDGPNLSTEPRGFCRPTSPDTYLVHPHDIGSILTIYSASGWHAGDYPVTGVGITSVGPPLVFAWWVNGDIGGSGASPASWMLHRTPLYLEFNKSQYVDFNALGFDLYDHVGDAS